MTQSSSIIMFGDSHCDIFASCPNQQRFNLHTAVFTIPRLTNFESWTALWPTLDTWLSAAPGQDLVVSIGEIDIRAHAWRQYPRVMYSKTINEYINELAGTLYSTLVRIVRKYRLNRCVLWGAPPAHDNKLYNADWPFSGSTGVRNRCVHLFNSEFQRLVLANPTNGIGFATAYYAFVDSEFNSTNNPSHDGVHYRDSYGPSFWTNLVLPAFEYGVGIVGQPLLDGEYSVVARAKTVGVRLADTWISGPGVAEEHAVEFQGQTYYYVKKDAALPCSEYLELELE